MDALPSDLARIIVPINASDDDIHQLARAAHQHGGPVLAMIEPRVWDGGHPRYQWTLDRGSDLRLPAANRYYAGAAFVLLRSLQMFELLQQEYGAAAMGSTVLRLFEVGGNVDTYLQAFASVYRSPRYSIASIETPRETNPWNPTEQRIDVLVGDAPEVHRLAADYGIARVIGSV